MVFEAVVVELLNKFLKQYVENLDTSHLKIGIWGGDVVLHDLKIKTTVFEDFNLPVTVKWGKLGKFAMNIPWKNLYSGQVTVTVEELLIVIIPNTEFKYDPVKEEKWEDERKQAKLREIEEARKRELDPESLKHADGFIEKLLTQIIKNIQVTINNIHIRYEDKTTIPNSPISVGLTLSNLSAQTTATDPSGYFTKMLKENENFICKILNLEGLAIYWNSNSVLYSNLVEKELARTLINSIPKLGLKTNNMYVFGPLSSAAFLRLNPKPEMDGTGFKIPKIFVQILLKQIDLAVTHTQFCDCMDVLEDSRRLQAANKYKKYRPVDLEVIGHTKEWWHFAYKCVTEDIIRRKLEWNWENIKNHRDLCRRYTELYKIKLNMKKLTSDQTQELSKLEKKLNLLNIILIRERAHVEIERELIVKRAEHKNGSWFSGWFSSRGSSMESTEDADELVKKIENVMTPQEKEKLFKAIGYEESAPPTKYPTTFVQFQFWFHLEEIKMVVYDDSISEPVSIMTMSVKDVRTEFEQRSSVNAFKLVAIIGNFRVIGKADKHGKYPELVTSNCKKSESLVEVLYETKPLNAPCDQRIHVNARPLKIVYHAKTINLVRETFTIKTREMEKIVAATSASLPTFQKITAFGLQYAIEKRVVLEVKVNFMASHLIIPYEGEYHQDKDMLVIMLGRLTVETEKNEKDVSVKKLYLEGTTDEEIFSTVVSASYTNFRFSLTGVQILFQLSGEDWVAASKVKGPSPMRFLESTNLELVIKKSLVTDDARIPKIIVQGTLPNLTFNLSEKRFVGLVALCCSIPTKTENSPFSTKGPPSAWSIQTLGINLESKLVHIQKDLSIVRPVVEFTQGIDLIGHFEVTEFAVIVSKSKDKEKYGDDEKFMKLKVTLMEVEVTSKTFETLYLLKIGGINFNHYHENSVVPVLSSGGLEKKQYLLTVEYVNLDTKIPDFFSMRQGVVNRLTLNTSALSVLINKEALLAQLKFARHIQSRVDDVKKQMQMDRQADAGKLKDEETEMTGREEKKVITKGKRFRKKSQQEVIDMLLVVVLEDINVVVDNKESQLCEFSLKGTKVNISSRKSSIIFDFTLKEIFLLDLSPLTLHHKIVASLEDQTMSSRVTLYNKEYFGNENTVDMTIDAQVSLIQLTFVNIFFSRAFKFLSAFQTQIESLKEGASVAAQRAKENLITAYQNQAQVCLNIEITAPILVVPKLSTSLETLILDMGVLTLRNTIHELDINPAEVENGRRPLIDTMNLHLEQVEIGRGSLKDSPTKTIETTFVVPMTLEITLKRNLSVGWFRVIPDLEIYARLEGIHVKLTHNDICMIMGIMRGNVNEGMTRVSRSTMRMRANRKALREKAAKSFPAGYISEEVKEKSEKEEITNYTIIKFVFHMDSVRFDATVEKEDENEEPEGLARFTLQTLSLKGRMFSDGSIQTSIMLISCLIDDTRPGKPGRLTRLMERCGDISASDENNTVNSMIQIRFNKQDFDTFIEVKVYKFTLILSMDFLQKLGEFFTLDEPVPPSKVDYVSKIPTIAEEYGSDENNPSFTFNIRLEKPDIIIVENMDSIDTDALIFNAEMVAKFRIIGSRQIISATLTDIELYSCSFNPARRPYTLSQVIKPFTISVAGSTPENRGLHIDICLTEIAITINPVTVDLLSKCYEALFKDPLAGQETSTEIDLSDLWDVKPFNADDFWFLKAEEGIDALSQLSVLTFDEEAKITDEVCLLAIPSIILTVEGRSYKRSVPLLLIEIGFQMQCYNWRYKMSLNSSLTVQMQYYNKALTAWEPLIEPVEVNPEKEDLHSYAPWELTCSLVLDEEGEIEDFTPPKMQMTVSCSEILQITLSKTCLEVLQVVSDTYSSAVKKRLGKALPEMAPFIIINKTGIVAELLLIESQLQICKALNESYEIVRLESNSEVELQFITDEEDDANKLRKSVSKLDSKLFVKFPLCGKQVYQLPLGMSSKRYYPFPLGDFSKMEKWGLVSEVSATESTTRVILRSIVRVQNDFNEPIHIHALLDNKSEAEFVGTVEGKSSFPLPFHAIYSSTKLLFFCVNGYRLSNEAFYWEAIKNEYCTSALLQCDSKTPERNDPFFIQAVGETEHIYYTNTKRKTMSSMCYIIYLQPIVKIFNSLPVPLEICFQGVCREKTLLPGNTLEITNAEPGSSTLTLRICNYLEKEWSCKESIQENPPEYFVWEFLSFNGLIPEVLNVGVRVTFKKMTAVYAIYCPYFMVNKTEHLLAYKFEGNSPAVYHPGDYQQPIMFSPPAKKFFSKKSACLQVGHSAWSDKFPVDVPGSGGLVECEDSTKNILYTISVTINLTQNSLTKIVTFTPYYIFVNSSNYDLECVEWNLQDNYWVNIPAGACVPFWPESLLRESIVQIRPKGSTETSPPFAVSSTDNILLRMKHKCGAIFAEIQATNSGTFIMFQNYEKGQAPVLLINHSPKTINILERDTKFEVSLLPKQQVLHTWVAPIKERQLIVKNARHMKDILILDQDSEGVIFLPQGDAIRYVSFLDGTQRTLLFTEEESLTKSISSIKTSVSSGLEVIFKIQGIGISLVNDLTREEILYLSLVSSNINWETRKQGKSKFVKMKDEKSNKLEFAYQRYIDNCETQADVNPVVSVSEKFVVNFQKMEIIFPNHRQLRRVFEPGVWAAYRYLDSQVMLHVKINRIQIDNQLLDCFFPIVLTPVPPPKTVVAELKGPRPFFELSILKVTTEQAGITQYKYFKILVQEFHVKFDIGFLQSVYEFMAKAETTDEEEKEKFRKELELTKRPLMMYVEVGSSIGRKNFYELLHFSPLKIHFSFSLAGNFDRSSLPPALTVIVQSVGVTLTDIHDVIFRLSYFERKSLFLTHSQLLTEVISHYHGQAIRQGYVLLLGLDVIGNPYGLIVGIGEGVEAFFYEPFQGIVQGPSDFAEGIAIGCKRFFKGTVGSTAGTLEKLTGTLGKGLAVLSLDKEYQMQRMESTQREETIQASMARGGRGLFMGVFDGVTGIVRKPIEGAKEEGVGGFFKGMGKGMMGLVTRPVTGVVDFASTSLSAVKRATVGVYGNKRVRPPRFFRDECLVRPYHFYDAKGNLIFHSLCKRRYCATDTYEYHFEMRDKEYVLLTNKRVILAEYKETFNSWQEHMAITWQSMPESPRCHTKGIALTLRLRLKKKSELGSKPEVKILLIDDVVVKERILKKMVELYNLELENSDFS